jgi:hypothetical protein
MQLNDEGHYGLPGMRERATIMGAKLTVWSEVDAGTEVELRVPAITAISAYATGRRGSWLSRLRRECEALRQGIRNDPQQAKVGEVANIRCTSPDYD